MVSSCTSEHHPPLPPFGYRQYSLGNGSNLELSVSLMVNSWIPYRIRDHSTLPHPQPPPLSPPPRLGTGARLPSQGKGVLRYLMEDPFTPFPLSNCTPSPSVLPAWASALSISLKVKEERGYEYLPPPFFFSLSLSLSLSFFFFCIARGLEKTLLPGKRLGNRRSIRCNILIYSWREH